MEHTTDQQARDLARTAIAMQKAHEKECTQVRIRIDEFMVETRDNINAIDSKINLGIGFTVATLICMVGFLFCKSMGWIT